MTQGFQQSACRVEFSHGFLYLKVIRQSFWEHTFWWFGTECEVNVENESSKYWSKWILQKVLINHV